MLSKNRFDENSPIFFTIFFITQKSRIFGTVRCRPQNKFTKISYFHDFFANFFFHELLEFSIFLNTIFWSKLPSFGFFMVLFWYNNQKLFAIFFCHHDFLIFGAFSEPKIPFSGKNSYFGPQFQALEQHPGILEKRHATT